MAEQPLIIVGASARAAAFSAIRAGMRPWCADLFADADLRAVCSVTRIKASSYPNGFEEILADAPDAPWIYTGGLENHPKLIDRLASIRLLWGNGGEVLRAVRDPVRLMHTLGDAGLMCPESRIRLPDPASTKVWLQKPLASAGGSGIRPWVRESTGKSRRTYYQEFVAGTSASAVYVGFAGQSALLGASRQLIGEPWLNAKPFHYCGSIGPLELSDELRQRFQRIGDLLVGTFGLRGLFGVDAVIRDNVPYLLEVNPRYTASIEVLELACGVCFIDWHRRAFDESGGPSAFRARPILTLGKAILFAGKPLSIPHEGPWTAAHSDFADIPAAGARIEAGWPVMTFLADGPTAEDVLKQLQRRANEVQGILFRAREASRERET